MAGELVESGYSGGEDPRALFLEELQNYEKKFALRRRREEAVASELEREHGHAQDQVSRDSWTLFRSCAVELRV